MCLQKQHRGQPPTITFAEEDEGHEDIIRSVEKYLEEEVSFSSSKRPSSSSAFTAAGIFMVYDDGLELRPADGHQPCASDCRFSSVVKT